MKSLRFPNFAEGVSTSDWELVSEEAKLNIAVELTWRDSTLILWTLYLSVQTALHLHRSTK